MHGLLNYILCGALRQIKHINAILSTQSMPDAHSITV